PAGTLSVTVDRLDEMVPWLEPHRAADVSWYIGSVQRSFTTELVDWLRRGDRLPACPEDEKEHAKTAPPTAGWQPTPQVTLLCSGDLPLRIDLPRPDMVGIDRLLA